MAMGWTTSAGDDLRSRSISSAPRRSGNGCAVETEVIKTGSTICFAQSLVKADDVVIARANATVSGGAEEGAVVHSQNASR